MHACIHVYIHVHTQAHASTHNKYSLAMIINFDFKVGFWLINYVYRVLAILGTYINIKPIAIVSFLYSTRQKAA